eukprot:TRINITY_DN22446_c0_g1_i1.p1 TRINITY_DN22446_c0_g1~~TRINITY_DN22446_c0_g1_i1.p1  ORF type:complete len:961 (+),score=187.42 TRINITY_DN22446_c0_g1_i1:48-2885(+)
MSSPRVRAAMSPTRTPMYSADSSMACRHSEMQPYPIIAQQGDFTQQQQSQQQPMSVDDHWAQSYPMMMQSSTPQLAAAATANFPNGVGRHRWQNSGAAVPSSPGIFTPRQNLRPTLAVPPTTPPRQCNGYAEAPQQHQEAAAPLASPSLMKPQQLMRNGPGPLVPPSLLSPRQSQAGHMSPAPGPCLSPGRADMAFEPRTCAAMAPSSPLAAPGSQMRWRSPGPGPLYDQGFSPRGLSPQPQSHFEVPSFGRRLAPDMALGLQQVRHSQSPLAQRSEDSLALQLKALQEAKSQAAQQIAASEQTIAQRQDQLRRETYSALYASGLGEALKRWPSPGPEDQNQRSQAGLMRNSRPSSPSPFEGFAEAQLRQTRLFGLGMERSATPQGFGAPAAEQPPEHHSYESIHISSAGGDVHERQYGTLGASDSDNHASHHNTQGGMMGPGASDAGSSYNMQLDHQKAGPAGHGLYADDQELPGESSSIPRQAHQAETADEQRRREAAEEESAAKMIQSRWRAKKDSSPPPSPKPATFPTEPVASVSEPVVEPLHQPAPQERVTPTRSRGEDAMDTARRQMEARASNEFQTKGPVPESVVAQPVDNGDDVPRQVSPNRSRPGLGRSPSPASRSGRRGSLPPSAVLPPQVMQEELSRCTEALGVCARGITTKGLRELRAMTKPPAPVLKILEALALLLGIKDTKLPSLRKLLADNLPSRLAGFDPSSITTVQGTKLRPLLDSSDVRQGVIFKTCAPAMGLASWCENVSTYLAKTHPSWGAGSNQRQDWLDYTTPGGSTRDSADRQPSQLQQPAPVDSRNGRSSLIVEPDLSRLSYNEQQSVRNLKVTKPEVGSVVFHGVTDCADLDIESIVVLKRGYVLVYPDPRNKPPVGQGLNKRATVTMYQCFPPGERVNDEYAVEDYKEKIKKMTEENSACKFLDYDCQTGVWKFEVERF